MSLKRWGLGFRDFQAFNMAMLGKQLWRLMKDEKVPKGKYFSSSNPWKVNATPYFSFLWKSLLEGRKIALNGGI